MCPNSAGHWVLEQADRMKSVAHWSFFHCDCETSAQRSCFLCLYLLSCCMQTLPKSLPKFERKIQFEWLLWYITRVYGNDCHLSCNLMTRCPFITGSWINELIDLKCHFNKVAQKYNFHIICNPFTFHSPTIHNEFPKKELFTKTLSFKWIPWMK